MEALWVHQWHDVVEPDLLRRMLRSAEPRARAAEGFDELWRLAYESASGSALVDLLGGIPLLLDSGLRARAYDRVTPLLAALPPEWVTPGVDAYLDQHPESRPAGTGTLDEEEGHGHGHGHGH